MTASSLIKKLQLKPGYKIAIINQPDYYLDLLGDLPEGVTHPKRTNSDCGLVHLFVSSCAELKKHLPRATKMLKPDGVFWISYPKKSSGIKTDISRDNGWEPLTKLGLRGVAAISIDQTWSALRFQPIELLKKRA